VTWDTAFLPQKGSYPYKPRKYPGQNLHLIESAANRVSMYMLLQEKPAAMPPILSPAEVAELLQVPVRTLG